MRLVVLRCVDDVVVVKEDGSRLFDDRLSTEKVTCLTATVRVRNLMFGQTLLEEKASRCPRMIRLLHCQE